MAETQKRIKPPVKKKKDKVGGEETLTSCGISQDERDKLEALDAFIEGVLQEAGEEFVDSFKQVEGQ